MKRSGILAISASAALFSAPAFAGQQPPLGVAPAVSAALTVPTCSSYCAAINSDGSIARAHAFTTSSHIGTGEYQVLFYSSTTSEKNISKCVWNVTLGYSTFGGDLSPGFVTVAGRIGTTNGVWIHTFNSAGASTDTPFLLEVSC